MKITNKEILKTISQQLKVYQKKLELEKQIYTVNIRFADLMNAEYGADNWNNVDLKEKTFMTQEEYEKAFFTLNNANFAKHKAPELLAVPADTEVTFTDNEVAGEIPEVLKEIMH